MEEETKDKKNLLHLSHIITVYNINIRIGIGHVWMQNSKFQIFFPPPAWRLKSRRNKKRIATAVCKWQDESNKPN